LVQFTAVIVDRGASSGVFTTSSPASLIIDEESNSSFLAARDDPLPPSSEDDFRSADTSVDSELLSPCGSPVRMVTEQVLSGELVAGIVLHPAKLLSRARTVDIESSSEDYIPKKQVKTEEFEVITGPEEPLLFQVDIPEEDMQMADQLLQDANELIDNDPNFNVADIPLPFAKPPPPAPPGYVLLPEHLLPTAGVSHGLFVEVPNVLGDQVRTFPIESPSFPNAFPLDLDKPVSAHMTPAVFVNENVKLDVAFRLLQRVGQRLAIVLSRNRTEIGVVSSEDILKVMFGEMKL